MQVDFDLSRLSDAGIQQLLYSLVDTQSRNSLFANTIRVAFLLETQRRMTGGDRIDLAIPPMEDASAKGIVSHLLAVKTTLQAAQKALGESRKELAVEIELMNALILAVRGAVRERCAAAH
jgi:hypothetical protein